MKTLTVQQVEAAAKVSHSFAIEIVHGRFLQKKIIYLNKGNYAASSIYFLEKKFNATFEKGNDAPKGGKHGDFVKMISADSSFDEFKAKLEELDSKMFDEQTKFQAERKAAIDAFEITEITKASFLVKTAGMSNKQARKVAYNISGRILGFYSTEAAAKLMQLRKN